MTTDDEVVTAEDIFRQITFIYQELGKRLEEFNRLMLKKS